MSITAVQQAALDHLEAVTGLPDTVWPNEAEIATTPRLEVYEGPVSGQVVTLAGQSDMQTLLQVDVVVKAGTFVGVMKSEIQRVLDAFPVGQVFGDAQVNGPAVPGGYRHDGAEYRCSIQFHTGSALRRLK